MKGKSTCDVMFASRWVDLGRIFLGPINFLQNSSWWVGLVQIRQMNIISSKYSCCEERFQAEKRRNHKSSPNKYSSKWNGKTWESFFMNACLLIFNFFNESSALEKLAAVSKEMNFDQQVESQQRNLLEKNCFRSIKSLIYIYKVEKGFSFRVCREVLTERSNIERIAWL